jgi:hypothetical protein
MLANTVCSTGFEIRKFGQRDAEGAAKDDIDDARHADGDEHDRRPVARAIENAEHGDDERARQNEAERHQDRGIDHEHQRGEADAEIVVPGEAAKAVDVVEPEARAQVPESDNEKTSRHHMRKECRVEAGRGLAEQHRGPLDLARNDREQEDGKQDAGGGQDRVEIHAAAALRRAGRLGAHD